MLMTRLQKLTTASVLKWVSSSFAENHLRLSRTPLKPIFPNAQTLRLYSSRRGLETENSVNLENTLTSNGENAARISRVIIKEAQAALLDYLHCTRGLQFMDAENMSKNSPHFLEKLLRRVDNENEDEVGWSIARYLRYHPINEFEPFFESLGLKPSEYVPYLPRSLMFLTDDGLLLHNYTVLCRYGIARNKIGKIYKEAIEVFQYDFEVLPSKLQAYEELGISQSALIKFIVASPYLLIGDVNAAFVEVLEILKSSGFETCWIEENLLEEHSYNWSRMLEVLHWFSEKGCSDEQLGVLIGQHPDILFEGSGRTTFSLIGFLLKFGFTMSRIYSMFLQFPKIQVMKFVLNLRNCFLVFNKIEMEVAEIGKIIRSHPLLLGSIAIKKTNTLLTGLNVGKKRLSRYIQENPEELKNLVLGRRVEPLPAAKEDQKSKAQKLEFLLDKGFVENSNKMKAALKVFRGKGTELKERFDCIVNAGLDRKDVCKMIEVSPQILNLKKGVIEKKIDFLVNHLGHPVSSLASFPSYLSYRTERVKFRVFMYNWLEGQGVVGPRPALSTIVAMSDAKFLKVY
ncbi:transcription termination factor MTEF18, mitochondrial-like, partial [Prunus dulcis]|uniref:transcription termination factor MTEF18, mitochondrial-like n=1 Tax=Prunus dulcis TaxID=3755 RepID=UPI0014829B57